MTKRRFRPMHFFTTRIFNRLMRRLAGRSRTPFAIIRHVGRRSGKPYETPLIIQPLDGSFVVALTYGPDVDWYRNVLAAGRCGILWHNKEYAIEKIEPMNVEEALSAFAWWQRPILRLRDVQHFVRMQPTEELSR